MSRTNELMDHACLFCKIGKKEIASKIIYEDEHVLAFLDIHPLTRGHAVVIPRAHIETILDARDEDIASLFSAVKKVTGFLKERLHPDGFTIGINHGRISGQSVDHLHIHVIPRYKGDGGGSIHGIVKNLPEELLEETHKKLISK